MQTAFNQFTSNLQYVKNLDALYVYLKDHLMLPNDLSDILRAEWIYCVSALDKLIHELVRIGMLEIYNGVRPETAKYLAFTLSTDSLTKMIQSRPASIPPAQYFFEQEIIQKHKYLSFQDPDKIADALSLIWINPHKWQHLASNLGSNHITLKTKLKTIAGRRNQMVHEADMNPTTGMRNDIKKEDTDSVIAFIESLGQQIFIAVSRTAPNHF